MSELAIETVGLAKTYRGWLGRGGQVALRGVDLAIPRGTAFGLIGPNGAGKTTFIKALLGIVRPTAGRVRVLGGDPEDPAVRARIGYLPERLELPPSRTPLQFLRSVARLKGLGSAAASDIDRLVGVVGLRGDAERRVGGFSKGMKQRLGLAAALLGAPDLLVLDEPTDGLDPIARMEVRVLLQAELRRGATLFLNSHLLAETERVCDRVGILRAGRVVREGPLEALRAEGRRWLARFVAGANGAAALAAAGFVAVPESDLWRFDGADEAALNAALDRARASGALLLELSRGLLSLEEVLVSTIESAA